MGRRKRVSQTAVHFVHLLRQTNQAFLKREGNFSPKEAVGMKEAGSYRFVDSFASSSLLSGD